MKLIYNVILRMAVTLLPVMALWSVVFFFTMVDEINDETDDSLEDYAELIMRRTLAGRELPSMGDGSNNSYALEFLGSSVNTPLPQMSYRDSLGYISEKRETEPARVLTTYFKDKEGAVYRLVVATPTFEREDLFESLFWQIVVLYVVVVLTVFVLTLLVFSRSMRPLFHLLAWLDKYIPGRGVKDFPSSSSVVEFEKLLQSAKSTISRAESFLEQQKQFLGNASHELQTPLAVLGNRIEWMLDTTVLTDEQAAELHKMQQTVRRLSRLNRTLLLLAKIDNGQFPDATGVDIVQLVSNDAELYSEIYASRGIVCNLSLPASFVVNINEELAVILVTNLLKNAFLHSVDGSIVSVSIEGGVLVVENDGEQELEADRLFDRFYKDGKSGGTGLGLALVGAVARYYNTAVEDSFVGGRHRFTVNLGTL